jgi:AraC-like DNA-binding protein
MSKNHFLRVFKQCYKTSPTDYLIRLRLSKALELMAESDRTVSEIAYEVGFSDSNYFTRQFRRVYGQPPTAFRKSYL